MLFGCFEELHTDFRTTAQHLQSGLDLLYNHKTPADKYDLVPRYLRPLLFSLSMQYGPTNSMIAAQASTILANDNFRILLTRIPRISTMDDASRSLDNTMNCMLSYFDILNNAGEAVVDRTLVLGRLKSILEEWDAEFARFLSRTSDLAEHQCLISQHLLIRARTALLLVQAFPFDNEMIFDRFEAALQYIVNLSRKYVSLCTRDKLKAPKYMFTLQSRILWPLSIIGTRCRNPLIRREAADLLERDDW